MKAKVEKNLDLFATRSSSSPLGSVKLVIWFHKPCFQDLLSVGFLLGFKKWRTEERKHFVVYLSLRHHLILIIRLCQSLFQGTGFQSPVCALNYHHISLPPCAQFLVMVATPSSCYCSSCYCLLLDHLTTVFY